VDVAAVDQATADPGGALTTAADALPVGETTAAGLGVGFNEEAAAQLPATAAAANALVEAAAAQVASTEPDVMQSESD